VETIRASERHLHRSQRQHDRRRFAVELEAEPRLQARHLRRDARDGKVSALIPFVEPDPEKNNNAGVEGVAIDAQGNVYGTEVSTEMLKKYVKASATTTR
jgi:hypothetical protein